MRDLLPLYVSGRLGDAEQGRVEAHLQGCADCAAEVELLRATVRAFEVASIDAASIAAHLPTARSARRARPFYSQPMWRAAAAITVMIAGTATMMLVRQPDFTAGNIGMGPDTGVSITAPGTTIPTRSESLGVLVATRSEKSISFGNNLSDLTDAQLEALLASLDKMDGSVATDPEVLTTRVSQDGAGRRNQ